MYINGRFTPDRSTKTIPIINPVTSAEGLISHTSVRVNCAICGEEINEREHIQNGQPLCYACAGPAYYTPIS